jgi:hypothetical protein
MCQPDECARDHIHANVRPSDGYARLVGRYHHGARKCPVRPLRDPPAQGAGNWVRARRWHPTPGQIGARGTCCGRPIAPWRWWNRPLRVTLKRSSVASSTCGTARWRNSHSKTAPSMRCLAINSMQVWPDVTGGLHEVKRVTRPGGRVVLGFTPYSGRSRAGIPELLSAAGLTDASVVETKRGFCALALKP